MPAARPDAYQLAARAGASAHGDAGASQRSAGSLSQCSSQDGAVLGRFPKPSAPFRTPAATPSLSDGGLVQSLLRQQVHCEGSANVGAPLTKRLDSLRVLTRRPPRRLLRHRPSGTRRCASSRARREISTTSRYAPRRNTPSHRHQVREMAGTIEALNGAPRRWWLALPCRVATA